MQANECGLLTVNRKIRGHFHHFPSAKEKPQGRRGILELPFRVLTGDVQTR
jgi:hypothetical protein